MLIKDNYVFGEHISKFIFTQVFSKTNLNGGVRIIIYLSVGRKEEKQKDYWKEEAFS